MHSRILALDAGSSAIKGVIFDETGRSLHEESAAVPLIRGKHGVVERDLGLVQRALGQLLSRMKTAAGRDFQRIEAVSVTGAGDGLILLDGSGHLVRPAITSLDTRASDLVARFKKSQDADALYRMIGEIPYPATALALLSWIKQNERESYDKAQAILFLKDWVRYRLTSEICTDHTDASATLTDFQGEYRQEIFEAFNVKEARAKTVEARRSHDVAGHVTRRASTLTGLKAGTPVVCGLHDCSASSLGTGCTRPGETCLIVGSWCGNQVVAGSPVLNPRHPDHQILRGYAIPGTWLIISASPTSLVNLDWFLSTFVSSASRGQADASSVHDLVDSLVSQAGMDESLIFHPYLYGSQTSEEASGGFYGVRPWHGLGHFLRSVYEGIAINYGIHEDSLQECLPIKSVTACGGGTRSRVLLQTIADALNRRIRLSSSAQTTALGAAITAAVGIGIYRGFPQACKAMTSVRATLSPRKPAVALLKKKRAVFTELYRQMTPLWRTMF